MLWCTFCQGYSGHVHDPSSRKTFCVVCGKILADISNTADKPTFAEMHLHGKRIKKPGTDCLESYERTSITRATHEIQQILEKLHIEDGDPRTNVAHRMYKTKDGDENAN